MTPLAILKHHATGAIERGEAARSNPLPTFQSMKTIFLSLVVCPLLGAGYVALLVLLHSIVH